MGKKKFDASPPICNRRNKYRGIDPLVVSIATSTARKAAGKGSMDNDDLPDLEQELILAGLKALENFDPDKGEKGALIKTAVTRRLFTLYSYRNSNGRDYRKTLSLNQEICQDGDDFATLLDMVASNGMISPATSEQINPYDQAFFNTDIRQVVSSLPAELQAIGKDIQTMSVREVAAKHNLSVGTVERRIAELRNILADFN